MSWNRWLLVSEPIGVKVAVDERPVTDPGSGPPGAEISTPELVERPDETPEIVSEEESWYERVPGYLLKVITDRNSSGPNWVIAVTGPLGKRKSTWTLYWAEQHELKVNDWTFDPDRQLAYNPKMFKAACDYLESIGDGKWHDIVVDDPTGEYSADQWMMPMARIMTSYLQTTSRRERKNVWFAVPNLVLIPKGARRITEYEAMMMERIRILGVAKLHKLRWNRYGENPPVFKRFFCYSESKRPKCWDRAEELARAWRRGFYTADKFEDKPPEKQATLTDQTYELVAADKESFMDPERGKITASMIIGGAFEKGKLKISRKVADEVLSRLNYTSRSSRPGSSAPSSRSETKPEPPVQSEAQTPE